MTPQHDNCAESCGYHRRQIRGLRPVVIVMMVVLKIRHFRINVPAIEPTKRRPLTASTALPRRFAFFLRVPFLGVCGLGSSKTQATDRTHNQNRRFDFAAFWNCFRGKRLISIFALIAAIARFVLRRLWICYTFNQNCILINYRLSRFQSSFEMSLSVVQNISAHYLMKTKSQIFKFMVSE